MKTSPPTDSAAGKDSRELIIDPGMVPAAVAVSAVAFPPDAGKGSRELRIDQGMDHAAPAAAVDEGYAPTPRGGIRRPRPPRATGSEMTPPPPPPPLARLMEVAFVGVALVLAIVLDRAWVVSLVGVALGGAAAILAVRLDRAWFVALVAAWRRGRRPR